VSEASVFYHYGDRAGLLQAVVEAGVRPLQSVVATSLIAGPDRREVISEFGAALERFLDQTLPVIIAAQSDAELRDRLIAYMTEHELGPHRGVEVLGGHIANEQTAGHARGDVDPYAVALMLVGACFLRVSQQKMPVHKVPLPSLEDVVSSLDQMLRPATPSAEGGRASKG
jgi:AcrR family transcriptional regulator